ncbi:MULTISPECIES: TetR/AcrR family transcriptional regulator [unclassified Streptomyces]|uniref:TetR/AcrR family transcriptional regulator n=1 Tax=unclassified Streptomyces TaxID=2593676 RepID=UPI00087EFC39|nr:MULTISPECIES: TetR/AcrR family transcriptional regulator [unclassified Streptomyces]PBC84200.1 TetR family transcriptional regulator [Streptomyces sp. 2321.6]SDR33894.1 transcriptional regulator, TetR family [Streptomyces sp. KS_16]SED23184.1 transcriptional regulator, TetR family [Streptomyces sp. 2133.1]SNC70282.1 DNA-binding transcriptional regulator, AcrR family [Streptomyces sp. 2114.4]
MQQPLHRRRPTPSNPRVQRTRNRVLTVARELLPQVGPTGLTYALLAEHADVTRQTLYRHWPNRAALLFDLILEGPDLGNYPEPGSDVRTVAVGWLTSLRDGISEPAIRTAVLAITVQADHDPDSAQALVRIGQDRRAALNTLLDPSGVQIDDTEHTLLYGPVLARLFLDRGQVTDEFIDTVVTQWLTTLERLRGRKLSER